MVGHENAHLLPSKVIPAVHIGCGVKSCGSGIDQYRALCALCEIELLSPHRRSLLCLWKDHTGRISCCCHWFLASPLRLHFLLDVSLTCSMYLCWCWVCAHTLLRLNQCMYRFYVCSLSPLKVVCVCVCVQAVCFLLWVCRQDDGPARLCMSTCCMRRAGWPPVLITSTLSAHFLSLCLHTEKLLLMSG